jgi:hypothetical protein
LILIQERGYFNIMKKPYSQFNETRLVEVKIMVNGHYTDDTEWDETLWVERGEDYYAMMHPQYKDKRVRIIDRELFLRSEKIDE